MSQTRTSSRPDHSTRAAVSSRAGTARRAQAPARTRTSRGRGAPDGQAPRREGTQTTRYLDAWWSRRLIGVPLYLWRLGLGPVAGRVWMVVTTTGRTTGRPRHVLVYPHRIGDHTYLWCPYGGRSQWFRNLSANPVATVQWHGETRVVRAEPLADADEAMEVVAALRTFGRSWFGSYLASQGLRDDDEDLRAHWRRLHVRRLDPATGPGPEPLRADRAWLWAVPAAVLLTGRPQRRRRRAGGQPAPTGQPAAPPAAPESPESAAAPQGPAAAE